MDRKEIIERLREMAAGPLVYGVVGPAGLGALSAAADLLAADGWVKVEAILPDISVEFQGWFVTNEGDGFYEPRCIRNDNGQIGIWGRVDYDTDDWDYGLTHITLTHWRRPLPPEPDHD